MVAGCGFAAAQCGKALPYRTGFSNGWEATPPKFRGAASGKIVAAPERHSLSALCSGKAAKSYQSTTLILTSAPFVRISGTYIAWPNTGNAWKLPGASARIS